MTDTTKDAAAAPVAKAKVVAPDVSKVAEAVGTDVKAVAPFLPQKVRAGIYTIAAPVAIIAAATAPVLGGQVGGICTIIAASATAVLGSTALSHIGK